MNGISDKNTGINFKSIRMKPIDLVVSCELLRCYSSTNNIRCGEKAFEIFDKYITQEAKTISETKHIDFAAVYDYMYKIFWNSLADLKLKYSGAENFVKQLCTRLKYNTDISQPDTNSAIKNYRNRAENISNKNEQGISYRKIAKEEGVSYTATRRASLRHRNQVKLKNGEIPNEIIEKAQSFITIFNIKKPLNDVIEWLAANPALIPADMTELGGKIDILSKNLNVSKEKLTESGFKSIVVYTAKPETTINNIDTAIKNIETLFEVSVNRDDYIKAYLAQPSTLAYKPETIVNKMKKVKEYLDDRNIIVDNSDYINSWIHSLWLLSSSTKSTIAKINKLYSDNASVDWPMIKNLFEEVVYMNTKKISNNMDDVINEFAPFGLTRKDYENAVRKQKPLAKQNPKTVINKVKDLSEIFIQYGLYLSNCVQVCIRQPSLFYQSPDTIKEHIRAYMYVYKNKYNQSGKEAMQNLVSNCLTYSSLKIYLNSIIYPQIKNSFSELEHLTLKNLPTNIAEFFKNNPNAECNIEIVNDVMKEHFIETINAFCQKYIGRNVFRYKIVNPPKTVHDIKSGPKASQTTTSKIKRNTIVTPSNDNVPPAKNKQIKLEVGDNKLTQPLTTSGVQALTDNNAPHEYISAPIIKTKTKSKELKALMKNGRLPIQYETKLINFIESFNYEGNISDLRKAFLKHTELFYMKLPVLVNNINVLAKNIEIEDKNLLIECLLKNPTPFYNSPQKLENNIKDLLMEFGQYGLTKDKLLKLYASKGSLLSSDKMLANNLRANLYAINFYSKNKTPNIDTIADNSITLPEVQIYIKKIIIPQLSGAIYSNTELTLNNFEESINTYLKKHPLKEFNIKIMNNHMADRFIEVVDEYSQKYFGRCIFTYTRNYK